MNICTSSIFQCSLVCTYVNKHARLLCQSFIFAFFFISKNKSCAYVLSLFILFCVSSLPLFPTTPFRPPNWRPLLFLSEFVLLSDGRVFFCFRVLKCWPLKQIGNHMILSGELYDDITQARDVIVCCSPTTVERKKNAHLLELHK